MQYEVETFDRFVLIGDKVLIKPRKAEEKTKAGLYLPPTVHEKEEVRSGFVIKAGPGYPIPSAEEPEEWKVDEDPARYIPLQVQEGDLAIFLQKASYEIEFNAEKYVIVSQSAILMAIRNEDLFD
jgi:co-chaperonin GroES (HSP10)